MSLFSRTLIQMYRRLGSKHLFQKKWTALLLYPDATKPKMIRKHPLLVLLSVLCKSLQRSLIFIALPFSAYALFGKAGAKVRRFLIPSKCFERKVCENILFFAMFDKTRDKTGYFKGKGGKKGERQETAFLLPNGPLRREKGSAKSKNQGSGEGERDFSE